LDEKLSLRLGPDSSKYVSAGVLGNLDCGNPSAACSGVDEDGLYLDNCISSGISGRGVGLYLPRQPEVEHGFEAHTVPSQTPRERQPWPTSVSSERRRNGGCLPQSSRLPRACSMPIEGPECTGRGG